MQSNCVCFGCCRVISLRRSIQLSYFKFTLRKSAPEGKDHFPVGEMCFEGIVHPKLKIMLHTIKVNAN